MADVGTWGAAITAGGAAIAAVVAAVRQPADVTALRSEVKSARDEVPAKVKEAVDAVRAAFDASIAEVRGNLASVAKRVGALEDWRKTSHAQNTVGRAAVVSNPDLSAIRDAEHERRIAVLESRADKADTRSERMDSAMTEARVSLGNVLGKLDAFVRGRSNQ